MYQKGKIKKLLKFMKRTLEVLEKYCTLSIEFKYLDLLFNRIVTLYNVTMNASAWLKELIQFQNEN